jgi:hypothetical protein
MRVSRLKPTAIRRTAQGEPETIEARGAAGNVCTCSWMRGASVRWQRRDGVSIAMSVTASMPKSSSATGLTEGRRKISFSF